MASSSYISLGSFKPKAVYIAKNQRLPLDESVNYNPRCLSSLLEKSLSRATQSHKGSTAHITLSNRIPPGSKNISYSPFSSTTYELFEKNPSYLPLLLLNSNQAKGQMKLSVERSNVTREQVFTTIPIISKDTALLPAIAIREKIQVIRNLPRTIKGSSSWELLLRKSKRSRMQGFAFDCKTVTFAFPKRTSIPPDCDSTSIGKPKKVQFVEEHYLSPESHHRISIPKNQGESVPTLPPEQLYRAKFILSSYSSSSSPSSSIYDYSHNPASSTALLDIDDSSTFTFNKTKIMHVENRQSMLSQGLQHAPPYHFSNGLTEFEFDKIEACLIFSRCQKIYEYRNRPFMDLDNGPEYNENDFAGEFWSW